jgi:hypothetical protein
MHKCGASGRSSPQAYAVHAVLVFKQTCCWLMGCGQGTAARCLLWVGWGGGT